MGADVNGRLVVGAGVTGIIGVICLPADKAAGDRVDFMRDGEIVEFAGVAGTLYTANTVTGVISATVAGVTQIAIGYTLEATRLIVRL